MKTKLAAIASLTGLTLLGALVQAAPAQQSGGPCPNVRATPIPARIDVSADSERCGFGIRIFGIGGGIFGPKCPDKKFIYPAHQQCQGDEHPGTWCRPDGFLDVDLEDCDCVEATVIGTGILIPRCKCSDGGTAGHVQDARTELCSIDA